MAIVTGSYGSRGSGISRSSSSKEQQVGSSSGVVAAVAVEEAVAVVGELQLH